jgi:nucleotide-binding universal stress UspA family protein
MTPHIDLSTYSAGADGILLKRVPRRLADYYLAFPLAEEGGRVTVVTAHPENTAALSVLRRLLGADIVPVACSESAVQEAIVRVYGAERADSQSILAWADDARWTETVQATALAFGRVLDQPVTAVDGGLTLAGHLHVIDGDECSLLVTHAATDEARRELLRRSPAPLLLVRGPLVQVRRMLVVLRGYGSDHQAVSHALPLLRHEGAKATVLPLTGKGIWHVNELLSGYAPERAHLEECLREMDSANVDVSLRLRQGDPAEQVIAELSHSPYDLLVMAAEARGEFVLDVLSRIEAAGVLPTRPVLILKPPVVPASSLD